MADLDVRRVTAWLAGLPAAAALALIAAYKTLFSPLFTGSCRFVPSCSTYARDAVLLHGALKGGWLALAAPCALPSALRGRPRPGAAPGAHLRSGSAQVGLSAHQRRTMERRVLLAVFLSFLVLYMYQAIFVPPPPDAPRAAPSRGGGA